MDKQKIKFGTPVVLYTGSRHKFGWALGTSDHQNGNYLEALFPTSDNGCGGFFARWESGFGMFKARSSRVALYNTLYYKMTYISRVSLYRIYPEIDLNYESHKKAFSLLRGLKAHRDIWRQKVKDTIPVEVHYPGTLAKSVEPEYWDHAMGYLDRYYLDLESSGIKVNGDVNG